MSTIESTRPLTAKGRATRARIVAAAAAEMRENGVAETTLDDVLARSHASKSQLFHYFPEGREQLLLAVAAYEAEQVIAHQQPLLGNLTTWEAWRTWRTETVAHYRLQGELCPLNALTSHIGRTTPGAQAVVGEMMRRWQSELRAGIVAMQDAGEVAATVDADQTAAALVAGIQGGVLMMMSTGSTANLEAAIDVVIAHLRST